MPRARLLSEPCAELFAAVARALRLLWAVLGNHDIFTDPDRITSVLVGAGIKVLSNQSVPIEREGARFWLSGVDDVLGRTADLDATLHAVPADEATILFGAQALNFADESSTLSRRPSTFRPLSRRAGAASTDAPLFTCPIWRGNMFGACTRLADSRLYTNPGIGTVRVPVRLNCPPEITLLTACAIRQNR